MGLSSDPTSLVLARFAGGDGAVSMLGRAVSGSGEGALRLRLLVAGATVVVVAGAIGAVEGALDMERVEREGASTESAFFFPRLPAAEEGAFLVLVMPDPVLSWFAGILAVLFLVLVVVVFLETFCAPVLFFFGAIFDEVEFDIEM